MRYDSPIGSETERQGNAWPGAWFDASGFGRGTSAAYVQSQGAYHTGADLNLPNFGDSRAQVFASADGVVDFVGMISGWAGSMIVLRHADGMWTRYAHLDEVRVTKGQAVKRGDWIGIIGDYPPAGGASDHLHFDVAKIDLGAKPGDWPRMDIARLERDYVDPKAWINSHREDPAPPQEGDYWTPADKAGSRIRTSPNTSTTKNVLGVLPFASVVKAGRDGTIPGWLRVEVVPERFTVTNTPLGPSAANGSIDGFVMATTMKPAPFVPPVIPKPRVGPVFGANTLYTTEAAIHAIANGAKAVVTVDNILGAREIARAHPDVAVVVRRTWDHSVGMPSPAWLVGELGVRRDDPPLVFVGLNENDHADWDAEWIPKRAAFDREMAMRIRDINPAHRYAAYVYPPACNEPGERYLADLVREHYAPAYNSGLMLVDNHGYGRDANTIRSVNAKGEYERLFYELRWLHLFACCGFDYNVRGIIGTEGGVDQGSVGGFKALRMSEADVRRWWDDLRRLSGDDWVKEFARLGGMAELGTPSPLLFTCGFQWGDSVVGLGRGGDRWAGYELADIYRDTMRAFWMQPDGVPEPPVPEPPKPEPPAPPPVTGQVSARRLIGIHAMTNGRAAEDAIARGCESITVMDNPIFARQLAKNGKLLVMHRRAFWGQLPPTDTFIGLHGIDPNGVDWDAAFVVLGTNENDSGVGGSPAEIQRRAEWDAANWATLRRCAPNVRYAGGGYAHGNIDFGDAAVVDAVKRHYAPLYNAGMLFNFHNYTKDDLGRFDPIWFETRWRFLFDLCGFSPTVRGIVTDETGLEGGACGGFIGCGWTPERFRAWADFYLRVQREGVGGKPSPMIAGTLFQMGGNGDPQWDRYEMRPYLDALADLWRAS